MLAEFVPYQDTRQLEFLLLINLFVFITLCGMLNIFFTPDNLIFILALMIASIMSVILGFLNIQCKRCDSPRVTAQS